jgi:hypothetical protein
MPEKGWSVLTVRFDTAKLVKEGALAAGITTDDYIRQLLNHQQVIVSGQTDKVSGSKGQMKGPDSEAISLVRVGCKIMRVEPKDAEWKGNRAYRRRQARLKSKCEIDH